MSRTELNSHTNMVVVGKHCVIFDNTRKTCTINTFSESAGKLDKMPIIDAATCKCSKWKAHIFT